MRQCCHNKQRNIQTAMLCHQPELRLMAMSAAVLACNREPLLLNMNVWMGLRWCIASSRSLAPVESRSTTCMMQISTCPGAVRILMICTNITGYASTSCTCTARFAGKCSLVQKTRCCTGAFQLAYHLQYRLYEVARFANSLCCPFLLSQHQFQH